MKKYVSNSRLWKQCVIFLLIMLSSCGYHLASTSNPMLNGINTIAIPYFKNDTFEAGIEAVFARAFADEFIKSKRLRVVRIDTSDVILRGAITSLREEIISYNKDDKALEYRVHAILDLTLEKRDTGEVLWKRKRLTHNEEYQVSGDIVVTETGKSIALEKVAQDLAKRVHESIIQGF